MLKYLVFISFFILGCQDKPFKSSKSSEKTLAKFNEWDLLSSEDSFEGWHIYQNQDGLKSGWSVKDGIFTFDQKNSKGEGNKSLLTDKVYLNFEIKFEWKLSPNSNSGFIWGVSEDSKYEHPHVTGPEIQIIDPDTYGDDPKHQIHNVGALYDMIPPNQIAAKPAGEWNKYHIIINHEKNEGVVILNEKEINRFPLSGPKWDAMVKDSKFSDMPGFGKYKQGHISFQDHPGVVSYQKIKIKRL